MMIERERGRGRKLETERQRVRNKPVLLPESSLIVPKNAVNVRGFDAVQPTRIKVA